MPRTSRAKVPRVQRRRRTILTDKERDRFDFLFKRLRGAPDDCPDVDTILQRLKARHVPLERLRDLLFEQMALDGLKTSDLARDGIDSFDSGVQALKQARKKLRRVETWLEAPALGVRPPALMELLDRCVSALDEAGAVREVMARRFGGPRAGAGSRRELVPLAGLGIPRDDARDLRRAVRQAAAADSFSGTPRIEYAMRRCSECGNPAPLLFKPSKD